MILEWSSTPALKHLQDGIGSLLNTGISFTKHQMPVVSLHVLHSLQITPIHQPIQSRKGFCCLQLHSLCFHVVEAMVSLVKKELKILIYLLLFVVISDGGNDRIKHGRPPSRQKVSKDSSDLSTCTMPATNLRPRLMVGLQCCNTDAADCKSVFQDPYKQKRLRTTSSSRVDR